jgi:hypothetical protein
MQRRTFGVVSPWLVVAGLAASIAFGVRRFHRPDESHARSELRSAEGKNQPDRLWPSLRAQTREVKSGSLIRLEWDPSAKPIRRSSYALLYIYDGGIPNKRVLDRRTLDFGSTDYKPASDEVTFHLVLPGGRPEGEFLLVLLGPRIGLEPEADAPLPHSSFNSEK